MPRTEVQTSARAEIWIKISTPCAPLLHLWDHTLGTRVSPKPLETHLNKWVKKGQPNECRYVGRKEETWMKSNSRWQRVNGKTPRYGRWREKGNIWTPTRAVTQVTRASPNSLETHQVRKGGALDTNGLWPRKGYNRYESNMNICTALLKDTGRELGHHHAPRCFPLLYSPLRTTEAKQVVNELHYLTKS